MAGSAQNLAHADALKFTTHIVTSYVAHHNIRESRLPSVIKSVYASLSGLNGGDSLARQTRQKPAIPIKKSVTPDFIVCLEDGKKLKMLKRRLRDVYGLSPAEYRAKWGLPLDYPMVAPNYAKKRAAVAKKMDLGKKRGSAR